MADTTPPSLTSLSLPGPVDLNAPNPTLTATLGAVDDATGVAEAIIFLDKALSIKQPQGNPVVEPALTLNATGNGTFTATEQLSPLTSAGTYTISDLVLIDGAGNRRDYTAAQVAALGLPAMFTLSVGSDATWTGTTSTDWNTGSNWSTGIVPTNAAFFNQSSASIIGANPSIGRIEFSGQSGGGLGLHLASLTLTGAGIINNSPHRASLSLLNGSVNFAGSATAADTSITGQDAHVSFAGSSTAANALITYNDGWMITNSSVSFADFSSAGNAIINLGFSAFSSVGFSGHSTAANASISGIGSVTFTGNSTGGNAALDLTYIESRVKTISFSGTVGPNGDNRVSAGSIAGNATLDLGANQLTVGLNDASTEFSGMIAGTGLLVKAGAGTWTLDGAASSYSGGTSITGGTLAVTGVGALGGSSALTFDGGSLAILSDLTTNRPVTLGAPQATIDTGSNNAVFAGSVGGGGALKKMGGGMLTLSHTNSYSGGTSVDGGILELAAAGAAGSGNIALASASKATVKIDDAAFTSDSQGQRVLGNTIVGFVEGETIDLPDVTFDDTASAAVLPGNSLKINEKGQTYVLNFDPTQTFSDEQFHLLKDDSGHTAVQLGPIADPDTNSLVAGETASANNRAAGVLGNDIAPDIGSLTITTVSDSEHVASVPGTPIAGLYGSLTLNSDGTYSYLADNAAAIRAVTEGHPIDLFTYTEIDDQGGTAKATLAITIDRPPFAVNDITVDLEGATISANPNGGVLANDTDLDADELTVTSAGTMAGAFGTLSLSADGSYSYVADHTVAIEAAPANSEPTDVFTYTESDGRGGTASATLSIAIDRPPVAEDDFNVALEGATVATTRASGVLANDTDKDADALTVTSVGNMPGAFGTLSLNADGSYSYAANNTTAIDAAKADGHPVDVFTYTESDGHGGTAAAILTITVDRPPVAADDTNAVVAGKSVFGSSVLDNDRDPDSDALMLTGVRDAGHGAGILGGSLAGQYGTLTLNVDGSYRYTADNAAVLGEGEGADDLFTYAVADPSGAMATATLDIKVIGHSGGTMEIVSYTAVESTTGDVISGVLFDNTGKYTVGSTVTTAGTDGANGNWTYTVTNVGRADAAHQDVAYSGLAYDFDYHDAETGIVYNTVYGHTGFNQGINDKANFSGRNGLGSDGDLVVISGKDFAIASGKYVVPEGAQAAASMVMKAVSFQAQESVSGDTISGVLFDDGSGKYAVGNSVSKGPDNAGGNWVYTVTSIADADAKHQDTKFQNFVYDLSYKDADLGITMSTVFGSAGLGSGDISINYSGKAGLGSDGDLVTVNGQTFAIASGKYVAPAPQQTAGTMTIDTFTAIESRTHDHINGVLFDNQGLYTVGTSVTTGQDNAGGTWTYTVNSVASADNAHQDVRYDKIVYDLTYFDADTQQSFNTVYGMTGLNTGRDDTTTNYSGKGGLGSDGDLITVGDTFTAIGSGKYVLPDFLGASPNTLGFTASNSLASGGAGSVNLPLLNNYTAASLVPPGGQSGPPMIEPSLTAQQVSLTQPLG